ncbi:MAG: hypothetical protein KDA21_11280, partial [Phycisphaerales bacterium]|nr:hypothetical protein [Phycisphaerales bacterium]
EAFVATTGEEEQRQPPRIILISDGNVTARRDGLAAAIGSAELTYLRVGPDPDTPRDNLGIVAFSARRDYEDPALVRVFARIVGAAPEPVDFVLAATIDGAPVGRFPLQTEAIPDGSRTELAWTFDVERTEEGVLLLQIERDDVLAADNAAALHLLPPAQVSVLLVRPGDGEATVADDFLAAALQTLDGVTLREASAESYGGLTPGEIHRHDLIVFDRVRPQSLPAVPTISFGATLPIPGLSIEPFAESDPRSRPTGFAFWQRSHPVMRYVGLNPVVIFRPLHLSLPVDGDGPSFRITELASGPGEPLIALLERNGIRRLVTGFELGRTSWWRDPSFPVFMAQAVTYLTLAGDDGAGRAVDTVTPVTVRAAPGTDTIRVLGPLEMSRAVSGDGSGRVSLGVLPRVGVYEAEGAIAEDSIICVNLVNERESLVTTTDTMEVAGQDTDAASTGRAAPREIWHWFVAAALGLLAIEWCLFAWRMRV